MERRTLQQLIIGTGFLFLLGAGSYKNLQNLRKAEPISFTDTTFDQIPETVNDYVNEHVMNHNLWIDAYGYLQQALHKEEENNFEVIKDKDGKLHYTYFATGIKDTAPYVKELAIFKEKFQDPLVPILYVMPLDKVIKGHTEFSTGLPNTYANETADDFIRQLNEIGIANIDLREDMNQSGIAYENLFYDGDHHWTISTAFWAFTNIVEKLQTEYGIEFDNTAYYTNQENYNVITYEKSFLGSMTRKAGIIYGVADDFTLIYPKFFTDYAMEISWGADGLNKTGRFEDIFINKQAFETQEDDYDIAADKYMSYLYGNYAKVFIRNNNLPDAPKILLVKDSFMVPVAAFLSTVCSEVHLIDPRYYEGEIADYINMTEGLDVVLTSFSPQNLSDEFFLNLNR